MGKLSLWHMRSRITNLIFQTKRNFELHSQVGPTKDEIRALRKELFDNLCRENLRQLLQFPVPEVNNTAVQEQRSALFSQEQKRQLSEVGRLQKINVEFESDGSFPESASLLMNRKISTPYNCAQHLGEQVLTRSVLAEVNGELWDMHKPLQQDCTLRFLHMKQKDQNVFHVNKVFWRSCSFMLGAMLESAFKDHIYVELHSFPPPNVRSGSFVYDVDLKIKDWKPNSDEMRHLSAGMVKLARRKLPFERLEISEELAKEMFASNKYKMEQVPQIAALSEGKVTVYRLGNFVDISKGPLMSHSGLLNKCTVTAVHPLENDSSMYRVQGVALPQEFLLNHFAYSIIEKNGRIFNKSRVPEAYAKPSSPLTEPIKDTQVKHLETATS